MVTANLLISKLGSEMIPLDDFLPQSAEQISPTEEDQNIEKSDQASKDDANRSTDSVEESGEKDEVCLFCI